MKLPNPHQAFRIRHKTYTTNALCECLPMGYHGVTTISQWKNRFLMLNLYSRFVRVKSFHLLFFPFRCLATSPHPKRETSTVETKKCPHAPCSWDHRMKFYNPPKSAHWIECCMCCWESPENHVCVEPKIGGFYPPKWMEKIMENPIKLDDLGVPPCTPYFWKHPNMLVKLWLKSMKILLKWYDLGGFPIFLETPHVPSHHHQRSQKIAVAHSEPVTTWQG